MRLPPPKLFINNEFVESESRETFQTFNPATEELICDVASANARDVDKAVEAATSAFYDGPWSRMKASERAAILFRLADLIDANREELAKLEGLPLCLSPKPEQKA